MSFSHQSDNDGRFSNAIWADCPDELRYSHDPDAGIFREEDFQNFGQSALVASNVGWYVGKAGPYKSYEDTGNAIIQDPTALGTMKMSIDTDNDSSALQSNSGVGVLGAITAGTSARKTWFETRLAAGQIATQNLFVGLMEEGNAVTDTIGDTGVIADKDYIGFQVAEAAASTLTFTYKKAGQTAQTPLATLATLVASTYVNVGFKYDPFEINVDRRFAIYLNGVVQGYLTNANLTAATFPSGEELAWIFVGGNAAATRTYFCQGWRFAQLY